MAKRKVTMLEAFQASAKESAERAAAERRRVVAEREREVRREGAKRTAHELSQRIGAGALSAWVSGLRDGSPAESEVALEEFPDPAEFEADAGDAPGDAADPTPEEHEATVGQLVRSIDELGVEGESAASEFPAAEPSAAEPSAAESSANEASADDASAAEDAAANLAGDQGRPSTAAALLESATAEEIEEAMSAIDDGVLSLPMSPRVFAIMAGLALVAAFLVGLGVGRRSEGAKAPVRQITRPTVRPVETPIPAATGEAMRPSSAPVLDPTDSGGVLVDTNPAEGEVDPQAVEAATLESPPPPTMADRAFLDPAMRFTVLAITYTKSEVNEDLAFETYDLLIEEGFPAIRPVDNGLRIFVFVGAAQTVPELQELRDELAGLRIGRSGRREFRDAYVVNLDDHR